MDEQTNKHLHDVTVSAWTSSITNNWTVFTNNNKRTLHEIVSLLVRLSLNILLPMRGFEFQEEYVEEVHNYYWPHKALWDW